MTCPAITFGSADHGRMPDQSGDSASVAKIAESRTPPTMPDTATRVGMRARRRVKTSVSEDSDTANAAAEPTTTASVSPSAADVAAEAASATPMAA
jgi:hypothetical protein